MLTNLRHLHTLLIHDILQRSLDCFGATKIPGNICHLKNLQALQMISANIDLVSQLGNLKLMRCLAIAEVRQSHVAELWSSLTQMPNLRRLNISAFDMDEVLDFKMLKFFRLAAKLEAGVPQLIFNFEKLTWLKLDWACLKEGPVGSLSHMSHLVDLLLYGSHLYGGEQLIFCAGWFPKLSFLQLAGMENLIWIEIEDGTMMSLKNLEFHGLCNLKVVPEGIRYIKTLHQMYLTDMSKEFLESMQGSGSHIVQHIPNIHTFESSDRHAVNDFHFVSYRYLVHKYGPGATKHAPTQWGSSGIRRF